jgi:peptidoglycan biosynthesis protein MviN/MurJ (putative lipid II flippase)
MTRLPDRLFWSLVLLMQLASITIELVLSDGLAAPAALLAAACCAPLAGLILQRRLRSHDFWAGFFGIAAVYGAFAAIAMLALVAAAAFVPHGQGALYALGAALALTQVLAVFGAFVYVFGSPQIWGVGEAEPARSQR